MRVQHRKSGRGGARKGAGRPRGSKNKPAPLVDVPEVVDAARIPWRSVRELAKAGCTTAEVLAALRIGTAAYDKNKIQFDQEMLSGAAALKVVARKAIIKLSMGRLRGASVQALLALLRHMFSGYDRAPEGSEAAAMLVDIETANARLLVSIEKIIGAQAVEVKEGKHEDKPSGGLVVGGVAQDG